MGRETKTNKAKITELEENLKALMNVMGDVTREYPAEEATRDPIFLLQRRLVEYTDMPPGYEYEDGTVHKTDNPEETLDWKEMVSRECAVEMWHTETVWFTRAEAEGELEARSYNYPDGGRVFCVCCEGELAKLLNAVTVEPIPEKKITDLPRSDRFKTEHYFSVERGRMRWRWTYTTDSGENLMGTATGYRRAKQAAEKKSGERIRS